MGCYSESAHLMSDLISISITEYNLFLFFTNDTMFLMGRVTTGKQYLSEYKIFIINKLRSYFPDSVLELNPGKRHRFRPTLRRLYPNDVHVGTDVADCSFAKATHHHFLAFDELLSDVAIDFARVPLGRRLC